jgi:hypothetical protein
MMHISESEPSPQEGLVIAHEIPDLGVVAEHFRKSADMLGIAQLRTLHALVQQATSDFLNQSPLVSGSADETSAHSALEQTLATFRAAGKAHAEGKSVTLQRVDITSSSISAILLDSTPQCEQPPVLVREQNKLATALGMRGNEHERYARRRTVPLAVVSDELDNPQQERLYTLARFVQYGMPCRLGQLAVARTTYSDPFLADRRQR